jgi:hypothetical protein
MAAARALGTVTTPVTDAAARPTAAPLWATSAAHGSAVQGETLGKHGWAMKLIGWLSDIEVVGRLSAATPLNDRCLAAVAGDRGTSPQLGGG